MQSIDITIIATYFLGILLLGAIVRRRRSRDADFFLAGRSMHWLPIGLSITLTAFSGINYTAFSGEVFSHGLYVALSLPVFVFVAFPVIRIIMPFYHQLGVCSAYQYLEKRFDRRVRVLASGLFILWRCFWMATALYVPARFLALLTGLNLYGLILLAGAVATGYTAVGGIRAVMWTDVFQFIVVIGGLLVVLVLAGHQYPEGWMGIVNTAAAGGLLKPLYPFDTTLFSLNPHVRITLWSSWIGTFVAFLSRYGADQVVVQRYFTARTLRTAQIAFHLNYVAAIVALTALTLLGFAMYAQAVASGGPGTHGDQPMAYLILLIRALPAGVTGLIVVGLIAATMSSIDSGVNACCTAFVTDFYRAPASGQTSDNSGSSHRLNFGLSILFGGIVTLAAMSVGRLGTVFEIANKIVNGFGSPLLALFILGMFSGQSRYFGVTATGVLIGGILGAGWSAWVSFCVESIALHYYAVINLMGTLFLCYAASLVDRCLRGRGASLEQLSWTWRELRLKRKKP